MGNRAIDEDAEEWLLRYLVGQEPFLNEEKPMEQELQDIQSIIKECEELGKKQAEAGNDAGSAAWMHNKLLAIIAAQLFRMFLLQLKGRPST